jgi:3-oxoacyl-(acyl-carrier-protein) synthase
MALALAARRIAGGEAERVLVVGADVLGPFILAGFGGLHALDPGACRPFDRRRRGISLGDGAGAILLSAHARDSIGCTLAGHGAANDACHVTGPDREGRGLALAAGRALRQAGCSTAGIDLIHVHGTGTVANDACEALGLCRLFHGATAPAFGTKAQTGHTLGAAGLLETGLAIEALRRGVAPANIGLEEPGVCPDLDLVREPRRLPRARRALKVSSGFGGILAAIVIEA